MPRASVPRWGRSVAACPQPRPQPCSLSVRCSAWHEQPSAVLGQGWQSPGCCVWMWEAAETRVPSQEWRGKLFGPVLLLRLVPATPFCGCLPFFKTGLKHFLGWLFVKGSQAVA